MNESYPLPEKKIFGWANTNFSHSLVATPKTAEEIQSVVQTAKSSGKKILARGAGQSYGDEALGGGQIIIDMSGMNRIIGWDSASGLLKVRAGATYDEVLARCLKDNWVLAVIPGTRFVTMGGALSNNVHGKNSYSKGNFGEWVKEFKIVLASGEYYTCSPEANKELFFAVIGGAGLLGIVTEMTLQLVRIPSPYLAVRKSTAPSLGKLLDELDKATDENEFAIAQIDCFPQSSGLGRGTMHAGNFISGDSHTKDTEKMRSIPERMFGVFPKKWIPRVGKYILNDYTMSLVSRLKYHLDKRADQMVLHKQDTFQFIFFLDKVPDWKQVFRNGFYEYEPLIPKEKAREVIPQLIALTHKYNMPAYLSAIKSHRKDDFMLSYSMCGYSFALDIPRKPRQKEKQDRLFREMNKIVMGAGGMVYLAKDAHLTADEFGQMYKNAGHFMELKKKYDPDEMFQSDMYRRIFKRNK